MPLPGRRTANRAARRDAILDVAARSFLEHGYAGTTMSAIAQALGGSKGTLWNYFPSKEDLFAAVIERVSESFRTQLLSILRPARDGPEHTLRSYVREFLNKTTSPEAIALYRLAVGEANRFPEAGRIFFEHGPRLTQQMLAEYLSGAMARGQLRPGDPMAAARSLSGMGLAGCHQQILTGMIEQSTPALIEADVDRVVDTFMRAYGVSSG